MVSCGSENVNKIRYSVKTDVVESAIWEDLMKKYKCFLDAELNQCKNFIPDGSLCRNASPDNKCGMLIVEDDQRKTDEYHRAPRWYEKYYE